MEQTAVERLIDELSDIIGPIETTITGELKLAGAIKRAKEMEKAQKIKFAEHCLDKALDLDIRTAFSNVEQYYNETFKSE